MFLRDKFSEQDSGRIRALIKENSFSLLVSTIDGKPFVSHLPFLITETDGPIEHIIGHMANGNPQIDSVRGGHDLLVVFQGPHGYISPSWYEKPGVPTWNYTTVHLYGTAEVMEAPDDVRAMLDSLTAGHESANGTDWTMGNLSESFAERMINAITAFRLNVHDVQAKFKLSQNRGAQDRERVIDGLRRRGDADSTKMADLMDNK